MRKTRRQTILALDPGLRDLGYAILHGRTLVDSGVRTFRFVPSNQRHAAILRTLLDWVELYRPAALILEATPGNGHPTFHALRKLGQSIARLARTSGIPWAVYPAQTVRKALVGNGWASKRDVAVALASRYPTLSIYVRQNRRWKEKYFQNMFDALALAVHHQAQRR
jgi:Holliday junction resolvasome RuvABC endonuclease subunit